MAVVALAFGAPLTAAMLTPLANLLPQYAPFLRFDIQTLMIALGVCVMVLALTYAVFVQGAVGPGLVIRRSLILGVGGTAALFLFAGLETVLSDVVLEAMGLPTRLGTFVAAGFLAIAINEFRKRLKPDESLGERDSQAESPSTARQISPDTASEPS